ncbi:MAG: arginine--tRNA ligase [Candidatus Colwellbacteria bacterium]|nr:arginine--tRNA ligase [Candidatus Colwellbacteria bacterium]
MLERIRELIRGKLGELPFEVNFSDPPAGGEGRGHLNTNAAFPLAKQISASPLKAAEELKKYLEEKGADFFSKIEVAEPGFLNIWLTPEVIREELEEIVEAGEKWGTLKHLDKLSARARVIVEYSQPNIAKPMHVGHLRSTIIGDALANILEFAGYEVIRWNYLGDWGTQFGNVIAAYKLWGDKHEVERAPVEVLAGLYARFHEEMKKDPELEERGREEFRKLETGDKENRELWEWFKEESIKELNKIYALLDIKFDEWISESFYEKALPSLIDSLLKKGIAKESEGAVIVPLEKFNLPPALIRKSDEGTLYLTRDIANLEYRLKEYKADSVLYVVDNGQSLHFQQLFAVAEILRLKGDFHHIKFGLVLGEGLKRLSTRAGRHIALLEVINEAVERARKVIEGKQSKMSNEEKEEVAKVVGIGALKYNDLSQNRMADIAFDWDKMLSLQGNSAPYLQYTYARLKSILRKAENIPVFEAGAIEKEADLRLILKLAFFPEVIEEVSKNYLPHQLANYLYDLARAINDYYEKEPILKAEPGLRTARLHLVKAAAEVLKTGLGLLGIKTVERM